MKAVSLICLVVAMTTCPAMADQTPALRVQFQSPEKFRDLALSGASTERVQADLMKQLDQHLQALAGRYLPKGDTMEIVVTDIDMAGGFEPWRAPYLNNTRIIRDVYPPKFNFHFLWKTAAGQIKADREEALSDLNYLNWLDSRKYPNNDPLRYEKTLLDRWFAETFKPQGTQ